MNFELKAECYYIWIPVYIQTSTEIAIHMMNCYDGDMGIILMHLCPPNDSKENATMSFYNNQADIKVHFKRLDID